MKIFGNNAKYISEIIKREIIKETGSFNNGFDIKPEDTEKILSKIFGIWQRVNGVYVDCIQYYHNLSNLIDGIIMQSTEPRGYYTCAKNYRPLVYLNDFNMYSEGFNELVEFKNNVMLNEWRAFIIETLKEIDKKENTNLAEQYVKELGVLLNVKVIQENSRIKSQIENLNDEINQLKTETAKNKKYYEELLNGTQPAPTRKPRK